MGHSVAALLRELEPTDPALVEAAIAARLEVRSATLIGSLARGTWSAGSDADVVALIDGPTDTPAPFRGGDYVPDHDVGAPVDVFVFTEREAASWSPRYAAEVAAGIALLQR